MKWLIKNGTIASEEKTFLADLLLEDDKIIKIDTNIEDAEAKCIDAEGCYVMPGAVDIHTHMDLDVGIARAIDDFYTGTIAAACGGTTTIIDHMAFGPKGCNLMHQVKEYHKLADHNAVVDYGFHGVFQHVNDDILTSDDVIVSAASCTTNCLAPIVKVLDDNFGIERGFMTTIHAYTNDQVTLDVSHKKGIKERRGRACAMNIVPTSTGAAIAIGKVIPSLDGKLSGGAIRVPVSDGSLVDLSLELTEKVTVEEINSAFINNASETLVTTTDPIVSSDVIGTTCGALADLSLTKVVEHDGKQMVKVISWYDNEMGYSAQMVRTAKKLLSL